MKTKEVQVPYLQLIHGMSLAYDQLGSLVFDDVETMLNIVRSKQEVKKAVEQYNEVRTTIAQELCIVDKDGKPVLDKNNYTYKSDKDKEKTFQNLIALDDKQVTLKLPLLEQKKLTTAKGLTANMLSALSEVIVWE
jgi:hypothetical protein